MTSGGHQHHSSSVRDSHLDPSTPAFTPANLSSMGDGNFPPVELPNPSHSAIAHDHHATADALALQTYDGADTNVDASAYTSLVQFPVELLPTSTQTSLPRSEASLSLELQTVKAQMLHVHAMLLQQGVTIEANRLAQELLNARQLEQAPAAALTQGQAHTIVASSESTVGGSQPEEQQRQPEMQEIKPNKSTIFGLKPKSTLAEPHEAKFHGEEAQDPMLSFASHTGVKIVSGPKGTGHVCCGSFYPTVKGLLDHAAHDHDSRRARVDQRNGRFTMILEDPFDSDATRVSAENELDTDDEADSLERYARQTQAAEANAAILKATFAPPPQFDAEGVFTRRPTEAATNDRSEDREGQYATPEQLLNFPLPRPSTPAPDTASRRRKAAVRASRKVSDFTPDVAGIGHPTAAIDAWKPRAVREMGDEKEVCWLNTETLSLEFIQSTFGGILWSPGFFWVPGSTLLKSQSYIMLDGTREPYAPVEPGCHGAKLVGAFNSTMCDDPKGSVPTEANYIDVPVFWRAPGRDGYLYLGNYSQTRFSDKLDYDTMMDRVPLDVREFWAVQLTSKERPEWVTRHLIKELYPKPEYESPLPVTSEQRTVLRAEVAMPGAAVMASTATEPSKVFHRHALARLAQHALDMAAWERDARRKVSQLTPEAVLDAFARSDSDAEPCLRLYWEYLQCERYDEPMYRFLVRINACPDLQRPGEWDASRVDTTLLRKIPDVERERAAAVAKVSEAEANYKHGGLPPTARKVPDADIEQVSSRPHAPAPVPGPLVMDVSLNKLQVSSQGGKHYYSCDPYNQPGPKAGHAQAQALKKASERVEDPKGKAAALPPPPPPAPSSRHVPGKPVDLSSRRTPKAGGKSLPRLRIRTDFSADQAAEDHTEGSKMVFDDKGEYVPPHRRGKSDHSGQHE